MALVRTPGGRIGDDSSLDRSPKKNWVEKRGGLPKYVRTVANALVRSGKSRSRAIAMAIAAMKRWARGGDNVSPKVQAAAAKALAQWNAMKAMNASAVGNSGWEDIEALVAAIDAGDMELPDNIDELMNLVPEEDTMLDGIYEEVVDDASELASSLLAGAAPLHPPKEWFDDPKLDKPTALTVTSDGRIFGHVAAWHVDHIGLPGSRKPPRSRHNYAFFKTGVVATAEGEDVPVGQITLAGGHAPLNADAGTAVAHYDDTATAFADVNIGEDAHGIWVAGGVRPGVTDENIRAIRASAPSGDWRPINGNLEMVAICQVNVPGFPIARSMVAGGEVVSLVAAGASPLYALRQEETLVASIQALEDRVTRLADEVATKVHVNEETHTTVTTIVASADMTSLERMQSRLAEAKRSRLDARMSKLRS